LNSMHTDKRYMKRAIQLAARAKGETSPNPMVGAVIVKRGKVVAEGYHRRAGLPHAEIVALRRAGASARGATMYVNLEPCNHVGRTPPCCDALISSGIERVVVAMRDPNPLTKGKGLKRLTRSGIKITTGIMEEEARRLNEAFIKWIEKGLPFVTVKAAQSLDGKIATRTGDSKWITDISSRKAAHELRMKSDAVMVGINTVLKDDPLLTSHLIQKRNRVRNSKRVVVDSRLRTPETAKLFSQDPSGVIIATSGLARKAKVGRLRKMGVDILVLKRDKFGISLKSLLKELAKKDIINIMVEGGGTLSARLFEERLVDKAIFFVAPKIIGGRDTLTSVEGEGVRAVKDSLKLRDISFSQIKDDFIIEGYV